VNRDPDPVTIHLTADEALVLLEWLATQDNAERLPFDHPAEQTVLWDIEAQLEKALVTPFLPDYVERLTAARKRILDANS
jgi:hypothetical protein